MQRPPAPPVPPLAEFEELGRLVAHVRRRVWNGVARVLAPEGESVLAWALVSTLARSGPLSQRDLADAIGQHPAGVSRGLAELGRAGLTARAGDASDRRRHLVTLTPRGRRWHLRRRQRVLAAVRDVLGVLDPSERALLRGLLRSILAPRVVHGPASPEPSAVRARRATLR